MPAPVKTVTDFILPLGGIGAVEPHVAARADGGYDVYYSRQGASDTDAVAVHLNAFGSAVSLYNALSEQVPGITSGQSEGARLLNGTYVRVWAEEPVPSAGDEYEVFADIVLADGTEIVADFLIGGGAGDQIRPAVAASTNGGFAVAYEDQSSGEIIIKFYANNGSINNTVTISETPFGLLSDSLDTLSIVPLSNGNYAVAYSNSAIDAKIAIYNFDGSQVVLAPTFITNNPASTSSVIPDIIELANGNILVTYLGDSSVAFGNIHDQDGTLISGEIQLATGTSNSPRQAIVSAALEDGRFITVWVNASDQILGQMFFSDGTKDGTTFAVSSVSTGDQGRPTVTVLADGRILIAWETDENGSDQAKATIFDPRTEGQVISGTQDDDTYKGSEFADTIITGEGNDYVEGGSGKDEIFGGGGNDFLYGEAGDDIINGGLGNDTMEGNNGVDILNGGFGNDMINGGNKNDVLLGEGGEDTLNGNKGNDTLNGGDDDDVLNGGAGGDTLNGQAGDDELNGGGQADVLNGGSGDDDLNGGSGNDILNGGSGVDDLHGGNGTDQLFGNSGADVLRGGQGNDILTGGSDAGDFFFFVNGDVGADTIMDFQDGSDVFVFSGGILPGDISIASVGGGADTLITVNGYNMTIRVENVDSSNITLDDMTFI